MLVIFVEVPEASAAVVEGCADDCLAANGDDDHGLSEGPEILAFMEPARSAMLLGGRKIHSSTRIWAREAK